MNEKINKEINTIKDLIKERKEILIVIIFTTALFSLIGLRAYLYKAEDTEQIKAEEDCNYQAIEKAQEKYKKEFPSSSSCKDCEQKEGRGSYREEDYEFYYSECLINWQKKK